LKLPKTYNFSIKVAELLSRRLDAFGAPGVDAVYFNAYRHVPNVSRGAE